jgi:hypothetical protein
VTVVDLAYRGDGGDLACAIARGGARVVDGSTSSSAGDHAFDATGRPPPSGDAGASG